MAERYGVLPSDLLARGTTQDIYVYDVALSYQEHVRKQLRNKHGIPDEGPQWDSETLETKFKEFKESKRRTNE